ncbi:MAG TPA: hypothetical protein VF363_08665 [Candidatus Eisenbacteria bacterium]
MNRVYSSAVGCLAFLALIAWANPAASYGLSGVGGELGSLDPEHSGDGLAVGSHLEFEQQDSRVHLEPGFVYWANDGLSDFNPNFDLYYHFADPGSVSPYVGAGAGLHVYSFDGPGSGPGTDPGANFFGGVLFPSASARFFIEGRYVATDRSQASVMGGVTLPLTR